MDNTLINQVENEAEFARCYNDNADSLFRFFLYKVSDKNIALDLLQDDFSKLWQAYLAGQKINSCQSWLYKVGSNSVIDWYRRKKNLSLDVLMEAHMDFSVSEDPTYFQAEKSQAIHLFNKLSAADRQILTLRFVDDLPIKNIAKIFAVKPANVSLKIHRALERLRALTDLK